MIRAMLTACTFAVALTAGALLPLSSATAQQAKADTSAIVEMALGDENAPLTVIEYASFTCPHCASFHETTFKELKAAYIDTGKVRFVLRDVYFDRFGLWAGMTARCGGDAKYFGIADLLFENQKDWVAGGQDPALIVENLRRLGLSAGLSGEQFDACMQDGDKAQALVAWYQEHAERDGLEGTPSFLIDGKMYSNMSFDEFAKIIDEKIGG